MKNKKQRKHRECETGSLSLTLTFSVTFYKLLSSFYVLLFFFFFFFLRKLVSRFRYYYYFEHRRMPVSAFINEENEEAVRPSSVCARDSRTNKRMLHIEYRVFGVQWGFAHADTHNCRSRGSCGTLSREIRYKILPIKPNVTSCWTRVPTECMLGHCSLRVWPRNCT